MGCVGRTIVPPGNEPRGFDGVPMGEPLKELAAEDLALAEDAE